MNRAAPEVAVEMKRSWLIQRLRKPLGGSFAGMADNPFAFGGGLGNGGLSDAAMALLRGVFSFDYMGAAEFEWGAVPKALNVIAQATAEYEAFEMSNGILAICRRSHRSEVERRILGWAAGAGERLLERTRLERSLRPENEWDGDTCGWLELDNGFFFFTDRAMWEAVARLFGIAGAEGRRD